MFTYLYALLAGMVFGSFYVSCDEGSIRESIITPRSHCHYCKYVLRPKELIPIISFYIQRGCCTNCKRQIPIMYVAFECITGSIFLLTVYMIGIERELIIILSLFATSYYFTYRLLIYVNS